MLQVLAGQAGARPPVWMMRQAGRYLPEYREVRATTPDFLSFCYNPEKAAEVTLQPIRRYGFDASIVFADILLVPDALGQRVAFEEGIGPVLEPVTDRAGIDRLSLDGVQDHLRPVCETLGILKGALPPETTLIGFAGAPWTVATYMVAGRGSPVQAPARLMAYRQEADFAALIELLTEATADYLIAQAQAGAEVLQLFDTWAGSLSPSQFRKWCLEPTQKIIEKVRKSVGAIPIIGFPKGVGPLVEEFVAETGVDGVSVDTNMDMVWARDHLSDKTVVQGNLDPLLVVAGGEAMERATLELIELFRGRPFIFNLGHGLIPETPPEHVGRVVELIKSA